MKKFDKLLIKMGKQEDAIDKWLKDCPVDWDMASEIKIHIYCDENGIHEEAVLTPSVRPEKWN
tara:strand:- start:823 stop:1011 length:189 start_codon:yes stop_codon:yes gene_type:complete